MKWSDDAVAIHQQLDCPAPAPSGDLRDFLRALALWEMQYAATLTPADRQYIARWEGPDLQRIRAFLADTRPTATDLAGMLDRTEAAIDAWERFKRLRDKETLAAQKEDSKNEP